MEDFYGTRRIVIVTGMNGVGKTRWAQSQKCQRHDFTPESLLLRRGLLDEALKSFQKAPGGVRLYIDKPENDLHPRNQARLADLFAACHHLLVVETHSASLISRMGELVECGSLALEECEVILIHDHGQTRTTFDSEGILRDWPIGFLSA